MTFDLTANPLTLPASVPEDQLLAFMGPRSSIPKECWEGYYSYMPKGTRDAQKATTPKELGLVVSELFFCGLMNMKLNLRQHITNSEKEVLSTFYSVLSSRRPKHEHKMAWCIYFLQQCCESVDWSPK